MKYIERGLPGEFESYKKIYTCWEEEARRSEVKISLCYMRFCLKKTTGKQSKGVKLPIKQPSLVPLTLQLL